MIKYLEDFEKDWNKKIIYAPNGFGKTINAKKLYGTLKGNKNHPLLFTRRDIEKLVSSYKNTMYFGETAQNAEKNERTATSFSNTKPLRGFFKNNYNTFSMAKLKTCSFFIQSNEITKIDDINSIKKLDFNDLMKDILETDYIENDKILDYKLYKEAYYLLESKKGIKKEKVNKKHIVIEQYIYDYIKELREYLDKNDEKTCLLCGKKFKNAENLKKAVDKRILKYHPYDEDSLYNKLCHIVKEIENKYYKTAIMKYLFNFDISELESIDGKLKLINNYVIFCEINNKGLINNIGKITFLESNIQSIIQDFKENEKSISAEKKNISNINGFANYLIAEINDIIFPN